MLVGAKPNSLCAHRFFPISSVLILLFAIGHTLGFRHTDPSWGVDQALSILKRTMFHIQGFDRTYYGFYAVWLFRTVFLLFTVIVTWELGRLPAATLAQLPWLTWATRALLRRLSANQLALLFHGACDLLRDNLSLPFRRCGGGSLSTLTQRQLPLLSHDQRMT